MSRTAPRTANARHTSSATTFTLDRPSSGARLYATAHGIYETFLNDRRVGDVELAPGFTSYWAHLHVQTYDVTELLVAGDNVWEVVLSDGWYRGRTGNWQKADSYGETVAFLGQLETNGAVVASGPAWRSATGAIRAADLMAGQFEDRRAEPTEWAPVAVVDHDLARLTTSPAPPTRRVQELRPVAVTRPRPDRQVVDLGQNINGWVRLTDLGPAGTDVTLVHGEALDPSGDVTQDHLSPGNDPGGVAVAVGQVDRVISAGRAGDAFEPRHTTHGFQYVRVEGHPHRLTPDDVTGVVVHTDLRRTGWFRCSDDTNQPVPRDHGLELPRQRVRDPHRLPPTRTGRLDRGLAALRSERRVSLRRRGVLAEVAAGPRRRPTPRRLCDELRARPGSTQGLGRSLGDVALLARLVGVGRCSRDRAVGAAARRTATTACSVSSGRRWSAGSSSPPSQHGRNDTPAARTLDQSGHRTSDTSGTAGSTGVNGSSPAMTPPRASSTRSTRDMSGPRTSTTPQPSSPGSGECSVTTRRPCGFDELAAAALDAWRVEYIRADGSLTPDTQANHVRALAFGLVPAEMRRQTADRLVELIRDAGGHLGTGFLATPYLLPVLADTGHLDVAYELLLQDTEPSWLAMVERGATTVWENWEGITADGTVKDSLNHYSKGAVVSFLHTRVAGIQALDDHPGYRRFRIAPQPGGNLTWAEGVHDSPYGRIESSWRIDRGQFRLTATVPPATTAEIVLPDGTTVDQGPGTVTHQCTLT